MKYFWNLAFESAAGATEACILGLCRMQVIYLPFSLAISTENIHNLTLASIF
jgi:hypothetical protein